MVYRKKPFAVGEYYHVFNRGTDKRTIFTDQNDINRFFQSMVEFNTVEPIGSIFENSFVQKKPLKAKVAPSEPLVHFVAYCLNPNHYHFILQQASENGIPKFMQRLGTGYTNYFNELNDRTGALFQGTYKSIHIASDAYLLHVSAYVNLNDKVHQLGSLTPKLVKSISSWEEYVGKDTAGICKKEAILDQFKNSRHYKDFALSSLVTMRQRKREMKDLERFLLE